MQQPPDSADTAGATALVFNSSSTSASPAFGQGEIRLEGTCTQGAKAFQADFSPSDSADSLFSCFFHLPPFCFGTLPSLHSIPHALVLWHFRHLACAPADWQMLEATAMHSSPKATQKWSSPSTPVVWTMEPVPAEGAKYIYLLLGDRELVREGHSGRREQAKTPKSPARCWLLLNRWQWLIVEGQAAFLPSRQFLC